MSVDTQLPEAIFSLKRIRSIQRKRFTGSSPGRKRWRAAEPGQLGLG